MPQAAIQPLRDLPASTRSAVRPRAWTYSLLLHGSLGAALLAAAPIWVGHASQAERPLEVVRLAPRDLRSLPELERPDLLPAPSELQTVTEVEVAPEVVFETEAPADLPLDAEAKSGVSPAELSIQANLARLPRRARSAQDAAPSLPVAPSRTDASPARTPATPRTPATGGPSHPARLTRPLAPVYPERQKRVGGGASVVLVLELDAEGRVRDVAVASPDVHADFVRSAISAARAARFEPARENGLAVPAQIRVVVNYRLQ